LLEKAVRNFPFTKIALGTLLIAAMLPARANIGDTITELRQRYGSAKDMGGQMLFEVRIKDGQIVPARDAADKDTHFTITVYFDGIHSAMEVFTRNTSDPAKANMSQDDINAILAAMGGEVPWRQIVTQSGKPTWVWGNNKSQPPIWMARFDPAKSTSPDDAAVLVIMEYTQK
jgi:hypothetical protein